MTLKHKSIIVLIAMAMFFVSALSLTIYQIMTVSFQKVENQRVERNIRRVEAVIDDRFSQLSSKLSDWSSWDDTYKYIEDNNEEYVTSNLIEESFASIGVDEVLFINKNGILVNQIGVGKTYVSGIVNEVSQNFASGSALLEVDLETGINKGIIAVDKLLLLYVTREILKTDGSGDPNGYLVFGRYFDQSLMNSMKNLTQFEAKLSLWNDINLSADYQEMKNIYINNGKKSLVKILDNKTISGYVVIEDVFSKPVAIVRSDIGRDIALQGKEGMRLLVGILMLSGLIIVIIDYILLINVVLKKILLMAADVDNLRKSPSTKRLKVGKRIDEVDVLREEINEMLISIETEKHKGESLIDLVNSIVVMLDISGEIKMMNKKGLEILGYKNEEVIGKNWFQTFIPPENRGEVFNFFTNLTEVNLAPNSETENEVLTKDNRKLLIFWHNAVIKDEDGRIVSILALGEDITLKKEEEKRKEEYGKELERLNAAMVGRELKMIELKNEIERLKIFDKSESTKVESTVELTKNNEK
ncbi:MAG: CHASE4 domain-containing protein [Candidatus Shapirobacteria bacterium]